MDQGYHACQKFIKNKLIQPHIDWQRLEANVVDHKSILYALCQKENKQLLFVGIGENLEDINNRFHMALEIDGMQVTDAVGKSKKIAEQQAAKLYLQELEIIRS